jgi:hypothetical protein
LDLFQQGRYVQVKDAVPTPCKANGYYSVFADPGNPDKALEAAAFKRVFGRDPSAAEKADLFARAWTLFEKIWRGPGDVMSGKPGWMDQDINRDPWPGYWTYSTAGTVEPTTWTKGFLDIFYPTWSKSVAMSSMQKMSASATVKPTARIALATNKRFAAVAPTGLKPAAASKTSSTTTWLVMGGAGLLVVSAVAIYLVRR